MKQVPQSPQFPQLRTTSPSDRRCRFDADAVPVSVRAVEERAHGLRHVHAGDGCSSAATSQPLSASSAAPPARTKVIPAATTAAERRGERRGAGRPIGTHTDMATLASHTVITHNNPLANSANLSTCNVVNELKWQERCPAPPLRWNGGAHRADGEKAAKSDELAYSKINCKK